MDFYLRLLCKRYADSNNKCAIYKFNPFMPSGLFYINTLDQSISNRRGFLLLPCSIEIPVFSANSVDPDQTPCSSASDLRLHCLPMSLLWEARHKWVKKNIDNTLISFSFFATFRKSPNDI